MQNLAVGLRGSSDDELGALAGGGEPGRAAQHLAFLAVGHDLGGDLPHGRQDRFLPLLRGQGLQRSLGGQFDVHAQAVHQLARLVQQVGRGARDGLEVDVAVEFLFLPQLADDGEHPLHGVLRAGPDAGAQEQALDVVAFVELHRELHHLLRRKGRAWNVIASAVGAVGAVETAGVGVQELQQADAAPVSREGVADARGRGRSETARTRAPGRPRRGAGRIVSCRRGQDIQLFRKLHTDTIQPYSITRKADPVFFRT